MKRFRFPLERILGLYRSEERQARQLLARAAQRLATLGDERQRVLMADRGLDLVRPGDRGYAPVLAAKAAALEVLITQAEAEREKARHEFLERRSRRMSVSNVRERALLRWRTDTERAQARELDEIGRGPFARDGRAEETT
jgi:flagellar biosynthesis chaperone FliJ